MFFDINKQTIKTKYDFVTKNFVVMFLRFYRVKFILKFFKKLKNN